MNKDEQILEMLKSFNDGESTEKERELIKEISQKANEINERKEVK